MVQKQIASMAPSRKAAPYVALNRPSRLLAHDAVCADNCLGAATALGLVSAPANNGDAHHLSATPFSTSGEALAVLLDTGDGRSSERVAPFRIEVSTETDDGLVQHRIIQNCNTRLSS